MIYRKAPVKLKTVAVPITKIESSVGFAYIA